MSNLKNLLWYLLPFCINTIVQLVSLSIFTKYLDPSDFGVYALVMVFSTIAVTISNAGLLTIYQRNFFEIEDSKRKDLLFSCVIFVICMLFCMWTLTYFTYDLFKHAFKFDAISVLWVLIGLFFFGVQSVNQFFFSTLKNTYKAKEYSVLQIVEKLLSFAFSFFLIVKCQLKFEGILLGQSISVLVLLIYFVVTQFDFSTRFNLNFLISSLQLSIPLSVSNLTKVFGNQSDKYMIGYFGAISGVGIYDIAQKISNLSFVFSTAIQNVYSPVVYEKFFSNDMEERKGIGEYLTPFFFLVCFFSFLLSIFSEEVILFFTTDDYVQAIPIIFLLSILYTSQFFTKQPQLVFAKKTKLLSVLSISTIILNIFLNIPLIKLFGLYGASYSTFISGMTYAFIYFYFSQKHAPILWKKKKIIFIYLFFVNSLILSYTLYYLDIQYSIRLSLKFLLVLMYVILVFKMNIVNRKMLNQSLLNLLNK